MMGPPSHDNCFNSFALWGCYQKPRLFTGGLTAVKKLHLPIEGSFLISSKKS